MALNPGSATVYYNLACFYVRAGEIERALECLEKRIEGGALPRAWVDNDPDFDSIRDDPRFRALVVRLSDDPSRPAGERRDDAQA